MKPVAFLRKGILKSAYKGGLYESALCAYCLFQEQEQKSEPWPEKCGLWLALCMSWLPAPNEIIW